MQAWSLISRWDTWGLDVGMTKEWSPGEGRSAAAMTVLSNEATGSSPGPGDASMQQAKQIEAPRGSCTLAQSSAAIPCSLRRLRHSALLYWF